ncbi:hypothetical protein GGX14DRAFT_611590 [Mycena pura]|uniref:Uncharacterized protein n=1 Tax=Mycena pura TaxID=153505 RepID=A0AAD7E4B0_9AGAR|nr:hypothetical protein GGX14DRAFT_611590 [Mycena pura]
MASKRSPRCRTCGMPMKGHDVQSCLATKVQAMASSLLSTPPASPPNAHAGPSGTSVRPPARTRNGNDLDIAVERHWRDPSWTPHVRQTVIQVPSNGPSLVPTVLVDDDGNTIPGSRTARRDAAAAVAAAFATSDDDEASDDGAYYVRDADRRPKTPMAQMMDQAHALRLCDPVLSIVRVRAADLPRMQATAGQSGLCTSIVRRPWAVRRFKDEFEPSVNWEQETDLWVVVGSDPGLVQRTADLQQQYETVPGAIKDDVVVVQATYNHIFLASTVSALVVLAAVGWFL